MRFNPSIFEQWLSGDIAAQGNVCFWRKADIAAGR
jgi:hypothetical protein